MNNNKKNKSTKKQKDTNQLSEADINNALIAIGKKTKNPSVKTLTKNFVNKIKSKTDNDNESTKSNKSTK